MTREGARPRSPHGLANLEYETSQILNRNDKIKNACTLGIAPAGRSLSSFAQLQ